MRWQGGAYQRARRPSELSAPHAQLGKRRQKVYIEVIKDVQPSRQPTMNEEREFPMIANPVQKTHLRPVAGFLIAATLVLGSFGTAFAQRGSTPAAPSDSAYSPMPVTVFGGNYVNVREASYAKPPRVAEANLAPNRTTYPQGVYSPASLDGGFTCGTRIWGTRLYPRCDGAGLN